MSGIRIVTDSFALLSSPSLAQHNKVTIIPGQVRFDDYTGIIGTDISHEEIIQRMKYGATPEILPPTVDDYFTAYQKLNQEVTRIVSLHPSRHLSESIRNADRASRMLLGRCDIQVIDSMSFSAGLGMLVEAAITASILSDNMDTVIRDIRQMINRIYSVFFVENLQTICEHGFISESQTILGTMLGIMPFLTVEDGQLLIMEKVRNYSQAVDKVVEYTAEFTQIEQIMILSSDRSASEVRHALQDRLMVEVAPAKLVSRVYDVLVAHYLGIDATGVFIFEGEEEEEDI